MSQPKKFIQTQDKSVCDKLVASGFLLLSDTCGTYTLTNINNINFDFSEIDIKKVVFTNRLTF